MNIKILDCTLRDGGYINHWRFGAESIKTIISKLSESGIDIIEIGFLTDLPHDGDCSLFSSEDEIRAVCPEKPKGMIAAMIAIGEKELSPETLPPASESIVDCVRITFHRSEEEIRKAEKFANILMEKGYLVCMQPVGITEYSDSEVITLLGLINRISPYAFYIVDTLGVMYKQDILHWLYLIDNNLSPDICIGFHSHNNLQMSFANAQEIIQFPTYRQFVIDSSVYGMGRGAGNLCTEIITDFLNKYHGADYGIYMQLEIIDEILMPFYAECPWGYTAAYYLSATRKCHPNYSAELLNKQTLRVSDIGEILESIPYSKRGLFDRALLNNLYIAYQMKKVDDSGARERLSGEIAGRPVLLIAPGKSVRGKTEDIEKYIREEDPVVISLNFVSEFKTDYIFISNLRRLSGGADFSSHKVIVTSNISSEQIETPYVFDYASLLNDNEMVYDNSGLMLIKLLTELNADRIALAGFDGFCENPSENYYSKAYIGMVDGSKYGVLNEKIREELAELSFGRELLFITPSMYQFDNTREKSEKTK